MSCLRSRRSRGIVCAVEILLAYTFNYYHNYNKSSYVGRPNSLTQQELTLQLPAVNDLLPHQAEIGEGLLVSESHELGLWVIVDLPPVEGDDFVGSGECLDGLAEDLFAVVEDVEEDVLFDDLPALDVAQNGVLYLRTDQILNHWSDFTVLALVLEEGLVKQNVLDGLVLQETSNAEDLFVLFSCDGHFQQSGHVSVPDVQEQFWLEQCSQLIGRQFERLIERDVLGDMLEYFSQLHQGMRIAKPFPPRLLWQLSQHQPFAVGAGEVTADHDYLIIYDIFVVSDEHLFIILFAALPQNMLQLANNLLVQDLLFDLMGVKTNLFNVFLIREHTVILRQKFIILNVRLRSSLHKHQIWLCLFTDLIDLSKIDVHVIERDQAQLNIFVRFCDDAAVRMFLHEMLVIYLLAFLQGELFIDGQGLLLF